MLVSLSIKDAMHEDVLTISPDSPLSDAATLMLSRKVGCLPVVDARCIAATDMLPRPVRTFLTWCTIDIAYSDYSR